MLIIMTSGILRITIVASLVAELNIADTTIHVMGFIYRDCDSTHARV
jgi:hypothetical protein